MQEKLKFKRGDLFFEPVLAFFSAYLGYMAIANGMTIGDRLEGRFRGGILKQIQFNMPTFLIDTFRGKTINEFEFTVDTDEPDQKGPGRKIESKELEKLWCQIMFGHSYEIALPSIESKFGDKSKRKLQWPATLQFAYHLRNGCFHGNTFDILNNAISTQIPTEWRGQKINYSDNGKQVIGTFIGSGDMLVLLYDIQKLLT
jgi:hypothetical protein